MRMPHRCQWSRHYSCVSWEWWPATMAKSMDSVRGLFPHWWEVHRWQCAKMSHAPSLFDEKNVKSVGLQKFSVENMSESPWERPWTSIEWSGSKFPIKLSVSKSKIFGEILWNLQQKRGSWNKPCCWGKTSKRTPQRSQPWSGMVRSWQLAIFIEGCKRFSKIFGKNFICYFFHVRPCWRQLNWLELRITLPRGSFVQEWCQVEWWSSPNEKW